MLLELALCILQDIIAKRSTRARSLQLVVAKTTDGDKTVVIENDCADVNAHSPLHQTKSRQQKSQMRSFAYLTQTESPGHFAIDWIGQKSGVRAAG